MPTKVPIQQGGTSLTEIPAGSVLVANAENTLTALSSTSGTKFLKNVDGVISWGDLPGGSATWGSITGTLSNQVDLQNALDTKVPYIGATADVNLGTHNIYANNLAISNWNDAYLHSVSNHPFGLVGTKEVDETNIANNRILQYNATTGKLEYIDKPNVVWGSITGTLFDQTDLKNALDDKANTALSNLNNVQIATNLVFADDSVPTTYCIKVDDQTTEDVDGNALYIQAGKGNGWGKGGYLEITAGNGGEYYDGGDLILYAGDGGNTSGGGGEVYLVGGYALKEGHGGNVWIYGGEAASVSGSKDGGDIFLIPGKKAGSGHDGKIYLGNPASPDFVAAILNTSLISASNKTFTFPNTSGTFVLDTASQTLTNKTITDPSNIIVSHLAINTQTGTSYTLTLSDDGKLVRMNNSSANTLIIPPNSSAAFPIGTKIMIQKYGTGNTTIQGASGVTVRDPNGLASITTQYDCRVLVKIGSGTGEGEWVII